MVPIKVMIIEDDETTINIYKKFVQKVDGFEIVASASLGKQALELLNVFTPDLILLDVYLPDMNGTDLLWEIRKEVRSVDVIMITAANDVRTVSEAIRGGAYSYMLKPIMINQFLSTLEQYKETKKKLSQSALIEQGEVNRFFGIMSQAAGAEYVEQTDQLPKGIDKHTLKKVRTHLHEASSSINAEETARATGASNSTVRRYLEYLVAAEEAEVEIMYGTIGRPERRYRKK
ncbi:response regulator [Domibacillus sp. DTU_2020_1001157_1_SI_ALB_TIR_016]|uniref:response regulator n=1 Tax=Domibacillus sp. DTU_2020_1001157_1_SI_ALB_TIR_016 TaxID=3077789 RepID=UPI0028E6417B|nr:response regulator [Domibacillus sp. DTU_2020_1001157_1_SI_ALB_TIR_016]WNS80561.1 response regulator [Domibacillus sp. DTU_2020_1001157_1_SI_ALB_TIR_016]